MKEIIFFAANSNEVRNNVEMAGLGMEEDLLVVFMKAYVVYYNVAMLFFFSFPLLFKICRSFIYFFIQFDSNNHDIVILIVQLI